MYRNRLAQMTARLAPLLFCLVPVPLIAQAKPATPQESSAAQGNPEVKVWVNTKSGVYHCSGTHWYGATKSGEYMKQSEAQQKGFRPAYYRPCK